MTLLAETQKLHPWITRLGEKIEQVIETHSAFVFLTQRYAFKYKKNVKFSFLDFSTSEKRQQTLNEELNLNRRLTSGVYLKVFPIYKVDGNWTDKLPEQKPREIEWVLQMRRLPESGMLPNLIKDQMLPHNALEKISIKIRSFHNNHKLLNLAPKEILETTRRNIQDNFNTLHNFFVQKNLKHQLELTFQVHEHQHRFLLQHVAEFKERVSKGYWVDGHGDLRLEHICFEENEVQIFDCLEFNKSFRTLDRLDEACFLASELDDLGMDKEGDAFLKLYDANQSSQKAKSWIGFFKSYRMIVRSKVAILSFLQHPDEAIHLERAKHCLETAVREIKPFLYQPKLIIISGLSGSGKTYVSKLVSKAISTEHIQSDQLRNQDKDRYAEDCRLNVYKTMLQKCQDAFKANRSIICDASFLIPKFRKPILDWARTNQVDFKFFELYCSEATSQSRISKRLSEKAKNRSDNNRELLSEADHEVFAGQKQQYCPPNEMHDHELVRINTDEGPEKALDIILGTIAHPG